MARKKLPPKQPPGLSAKERHEHSLSHVERDLRHYAVVDDVAFRFHFWDEGKLYVSPAHATLRELLLDDTPRDEWERGNARMVRDTQGPKVLSASQRRAYVLTTLDEITGRLGDDCVAWVRRNR